MLVQCSNETVVCGFPEMAESMYIDFINEGSPMKKIVIQVSNFQYPFSIISNDLSKNASGAGNLTVYNITDTFSFELTCALCVINPPQIFELDITCTPQPGFVMIYIYILHLQI